MKIWGLTDVGLARDRNQDSYMIHVDEQNKSAFCLVCDGMGGAAAGDIASKTAVDVFSSYLMEKNDFSLKEMEKIIVEAVEKANTEVYNLSLNHEEYQGMGTTLVCMLTLGGQTVIGNVGDSRAYLIDENGIKQITHDHSLVSEMMQRGEITQYQATRHPSRNVITRSIGVDEDVKCDIFKLNVKAGQYILLCSDGLTSEVSEPEIYYEVFFGEKPENACKTLVDIANMRGGHDNITALLAAF